jgi:hypothetical protein
MTEKHIAVFGIYQTRNQAERSVDDLLAANFVSFWQGCVRWADSRFLLGQEAADGGSADPKFPGDLGFANSLPM